MSSYIVECQFWFPRLLANGLCYNDNIPYCRSWAICYCELIARERWWFITTISPRLTNSSLCSLIFAPRITPAPKQLGADVILSPLSRSDLIAGGQHLVWHIYRDLEWNVIFEDFRNCPEILSKTVCDFVLWQCKISVVLKQAIRYSYQDSDKVVCLCPSGGSAQLWRSKERCWRDSFSHRWVAEVGDVGIMIAVGVQWDYK